jgi:hypothetical protein
LTDDVIDMHLLNYYPLLLMRILIKSKRSLNNVGNLVNIMRDYSISKKYEIIIASFRIIPLIFVRTDG